MGNGSVPDEPSFDLLMVGKPNFCRLVIDLTSERFCAPFDIGEESVSGFWIQWVIAFVPPEARSEVRAALPDHVEVATGANPHDAIAWLRDKHTYHRVNIKTNPTITIPLYNSIINKLQLNIFKNRYAIGEKIS